VDVGEEIGGATSRGPGLGDFGGKSEVGEDLANAPGMLDGASGRMRPPQRGQASTSSSIGIAWMRPSLMRWRQSWATEGAQQVTAELLEPGASVCRHDKVSVEIEPIEVDLARPG
jgi:hypothetical protein